MSGISLSYAIDDQAAMALFRRLEHVDTRLMFGEIGSQLASSVAQRFKDGVDPDGNPWEPSERAKREGGKTLVDHEVLKSSITYNAYTDSVEVGSNMVYAAIHQFGGKTGRNHATTLVARPFLGINADDEDEIEGIVDNFYRSVMKQ